MIVFHQDADAEITEAVQYYEVRKLGLGSVLLGAWIDIWHSPKRLIKGGTAFLSPNMR